MGGIRGAHDRTLIHAYPHIQVSGHTWSQFLMGYWEWFITTQHIFGLPILSFYRLPADYTHTHSNCTHCSNNNLSISQMFLGRVIRSQIAIDITLPETFVIIFTKHSEGRGQRNRQVWPNKPTDYWRRKNFPTAIPKLESHRRYQPLTRYADKRSIVNSPYWWVWWWESIRRNMFFIFGMLQLFLLRLLSVTGS